MEKIINFLITLSSLCAVLLVLVIIVLVIHYCRMKSEAKKLLSGSDRGSDFVCRLLRTVFPSSRIINQTLLPIGPGRRAVADIILVDRGGVFVIRVKTFPGMIDNANRATWTVTNIKGTGEFPNPFEQNRYAVTAVENILKRENLYNVPKHNLVVFSQKKVAFKIRSEKLLTAENLIETIQDLNRNRFLNKKEINATVAAIKKFSVPQSKQ